MNTIDQDFGQKISLVKHCTIQTTVAGPMFFITTPSASVLLPYVGSKLAGLGQMEKNRIVQCIPV